MQHVATAEISCVLSPFISLCRPDIYKLHDLSKMRVVAFRRQGIEKGQQNDCLPGQLFLLVCIATDLVRLFLEILKPAGQSAGLGRFGF